MKIPKKYRTLSNNQGFTQVELIVVIVIVLILMIGAVGAGMLLPALAKAKAKAQRISCVNNLKQVGIATRIYATDNQDRFPWQVPTIETGPDGEEVMTGGTAEYLASSKYKETWKHWQALSNMIGNPKVLRCPRDKNRNQVVSFSDSSFGGENGNLSYSYFIGKGADEAKPNNILSGDRNIMFGTYNNDDDNEGQHIKFGKKFSAKKSPLWTRSLHENQGDLLLSDSSCQQASSQKLAQYMLDSSDNELMFPRGK
jgi:prepilin-type N-terminal cleavage/methylation domain-containing protein